MFLRLRNPRLAVVAVSGRALEAPVLLLSRPLRGVRSPRPQPLGRFRHSDTSVYIHIHM